MAEVYKTIHCFSNESLLKTIVKFLRLISILLLALDGSVTTGRSSTYSAVSFLSYSSLQSPVCRNVQTLIKCYIRIWIIVLIKLIVVIESPVSAFVSAL